MLIKPVYDQHGSMLPNVNRHTSAAESRSHQRTMVWAGPLTPAELMSCFTTWAFRGLISWSDLPLCVAGLTPQLANNLKPTVTQFWRREPQSEHKTHWPMRTCTNQHTHTSPLPFGAVLPRHSNNSWYSPSPSFTLTLLHQLLFSNQLKSIYVSISHPFINTFPLSLLQSWRSPGRVRSPRSNRNIFCYVSFSACALLFKMHYQYDPPPISMGPS